MIDKKISDEVRGFIGRHIESVGKLETFLLLVRAPERSWRASEIASELRSSENSVKKFLNELHHASLVQIDPTNPSAYRYRPETAGPAVEELVIAFAVLQSRVIEIICNRSMTRIQNFANAFRLRKESDDDST